MSARYITTTLPYVNDNPHLGHALEFVQADTLARSWREEKSDVFFNTGTDEHGQKIFEAAQKAGQEVQEYVDHYAAEFKRLHDALDLSNDGFIRTTDPKHVSAAQEMWRRCSAKGDIYKKSYTGLYCVGCESFKTEKEIANNRCVIHTNLELQQITEENYFFKFSNYQDGLLQYLNRPDVIVPEWRRQEAINFVQEGLEDFSISREKARLSWGVSVPDDDTQVMYVWFDALTSYISTLGWPEDKDALFKKFWQEGAVLQMAGKDQIRFQSLMWQAMLMSAEVKNSDQVFYHGFINSDGQKMSKSLGNVISPYELVKKYGTDATRYILLRHVHPVEDSDITWERLDEWYTAHLTNGLGNLVARVMQLAEKNLVDPVTPTQEYKDVLKLEAYEQISSDMHLHLTYEACLNNFEFNRVLNLVWSYIEKLDGRITSEEPFKVIKVDEQKGRGLISQMVLELYQIGLMLKPFMPSTSKKILQAIKENKKPENLFPRLS